ncbi:hypothetical protein BFJ68_g1274 [Fusarium oxysporum]|uniref:Uncharacterized protein n=1 Tax=Fusarium oxysporum TaxID=5507 RepID=A0A420S1B8_FUSOX|nr:hypothetical protein BFJ68_g1274 [Fusarium oxysporum]
MTPRCSFTTITFADPLIVCHEGRHRQREVDTRLICEPGNLIHCYSGSEILYNQAGLRHKRCPSGAWNTIRNWSQELIDEAGDIIKAGDVAAELPGGRAENCQGRRWALYTTWRPLKPVKRDPMVYVDYWTADEQDGVSFWRNSPGVHGTFELDVLLTKANPKHKWYWISDQTPDEVLLMKITDTESEKNGSDVAGGVHHCSFHLPGTEDEEVRESIETKLITFW